MTDEAKRAMERMEREKRERERLAQRPPTFEPEPPEKWRYIMYLVAGGLAVVLLLILAYLFFD